MKICYFGNNLVGLKILEFLKRRGETIAALYIHPVKKAKFRREMIRVANVPANRIFDGSRVNNAKTIERLKALKPDIGISAFFGYILKSSLIEVFPKGCFNVHPAYLPFNRGANPNVWSIIDNTPAGVTIHKIDEGVDTGHIVSQKRIALGINDTGKSLYRKLEQESVRHFEQVWPSLRSQSYKLKAQNNKGTYHKLKDLEEIDEIDLEKRYQARHLLNIIRARTFNPYPGAYIKKNGKRIYLRLQFITESELNEGGSN